MSIITSFHSSSSVYEQLIEYRKVAIRSKSVLKILILKFSIKIITIQQKTLFDLSGQIALNNALMNPCLKQCKKV